MIILYVKFLQNFVYDVKYFNLSFIVILLILIAMVYSQLPPSILINIQSYFLLDIIILSVFHSLNEMEFILMCSLKCRPKFSSSSQIANQLSLLFFEKKSLSHCIVIFHHIVTF